MFHLKYLGYLCLSCLFFSAVQAEENFSHTAEASFRAAHSAFNGLALPASSAPAVTKLADLSAPIISEGFVKGIGRVRVVFNQRRGKTWSSASSIPYELLRGTVEYRTRRRGETKTVKTSGAFLRRDGSSKLRVYLEPHSLFARTTRRLYSVEFSPSLNGAAWNAARVTKAVSREGSCRSDVKGDRPMAANSSDVSANADSFRLATLRMVGDLQFFQSHGSNSESELATITNQVEVIYQRDLNLDLQITSITIIQSGSGGLTSSSAETLLDQFTSAYASDTADVRHLFTGKAIDTLGIAFISAVCRTPADSFGLSLDVNQAENVLTMAHEMGHNFGAEHDPSANPPTIMYPSDATGLEARFSTTSKNQIGTFVQNFGSCLDSSDGGTPPDNSDPDPEDPPSDSPVQSLQIFREKEDGKTFIDAYAVDASDEPLANQQVQFIFRAKKNAAEKVLAVKTTDEDGFAFVRAKKVGFYFVRVAGGTVASKTVQVKSLR